MAHQKLETRNSKTKRKKSKRNKKNKTFKKNKHTNSNDKFQEYTSQNKYAHVKFKANNNVMYVTVDYKNLEESNK
jgi:hypothetical protein